MDPILLSYAYGIVTGISIASLWVLTLGEFKRRRDLSQPNEDAAQREANVTAGDWFK